MMMQSTQTLPEVVVLDTNFFIALEEAGLPSILEKLEDFCSDVGMVVFTPDSVPKSDVPSKFRQLREKIPKYVRLKVVNRNSRFWKKTALDAFKNRLIRADKDPADIDVIVLAREFYAKGKVVAVVSDDEGVARAVNELSEFKGIQHFSCGAFLSVLAATAREEYQAILDDAVEKVFRKTWSYKRRTRRYIDLKLLAEDFLDTARFVRSAVKRQALQASAALVDPTAVLEPTNYFEQLVLLLNGCSEAREENNIYEAEQAEIRVTLEAPKILSQIRDLEMREIAQKYMHSVLFEHHTWMFQGYQQRQEIVQALVHIQSCLTHLKFIDVATEALENLLALRGLLFLLLGQIDSALESFESIAVSEDQPMSTVQLLGLIVALVAKERFQEAMKLVRRYPDLKEGLIDSIRGYSNIAFHRGQQRLAMNLLEFLILTFQKDVELVLSAAERLFILSRYRPDVPRKETYLALRKLLGKKYQDNTRKSVKRAWQQAVPIEIGLLNDKNYTKGFTARELEELRAFQGPYYVFEIRKFEEQNLMHVFVWNEPLACGWRHIISLDYYPAFEKTFSFKYMSGTITKISRKTKTDPDIIRGTIHVKNPVIQVTLFAATW